MEPKLTDSWVAGRLEALEQESTWSPDAGRGWERVRAAQSARRMRMGVAATSLLATAGLLAFPSTRVVAQRCVDACVAETATIAQKMGFPRAISAEPRPAAPDLSLTDSNGNVVRLSNFRGQVVLLNFWATWCAPCRHELPWFSEFQTQLGPKGLQVLGVAMDDDGWTRVRPAMQEHGLRFPVVLGNEQAAQAFGGVDQLPATFLIDRQGRIAAVHSGLVGRSEYERELARLLAEGN